MFEIKVLYLYYFTTAMKLYNNMGALLFPNPVKKSEINKNRNQIIIKDCYCQKGHILIHNKAIFDGFERLLIYKNINSFIPKPSFTMNRFTIPEWKL